MKGKKFSSQDVSRIAVLAQIPINKDQAKDLADGFTKTMMVVDELTEVDVSGVEATSQVAGLENVFRDDEIEIERTLTQDRILTNAKRTHNGFFVVDQILEQ